MENTLAEKKIITLKGKSSYPVYYEDTDLTGLVYHTNYIKFFERAREDMIGPKLLKSFRDHGLHFVVSHIDADYVFPAKHADVVDVITSVEISRSPKSIYTQKAYVGDQLCVAARITAIALNLENRPIRISNDQLALFDSL